VARDRKRAKQRRDRGRAAAVGRSSGAPAEGGVSTPSSSEPSPDAPQGLERVDVPGALDHASADVDEFDAALVRGAGGVPVENETAEEAFGSDDELQESGGSGGSGSGSGGITGGGGGGGRGGAETPSGAPIRDGNRVTGFLRASWAELQRVQWPDRRQVTQATAVVIGFVAIAGAYLGLADYVAKEIVEFIL
jgi:preprotein translocase subunit SecE